MNLPKTDLVRILVVSLIAATAAQFSLGGEGFTIEDTPSGLTVNYDGELVTNYVIDQANKPYLYPLIGPTGVPMTRAHPMENVEGEQHDHPHHRSIWFGHQSVNGFDTWLEARSGAEKNLNEVKQANFDKKLGRTIHRSFKKVDANEKRALIVTTNDYLGSGGETLMSDERTIVIRKTNSKVIVDFDIEFIASYGDVEIGDIKDAGLSVRIPSVMALKEGNGGRIINSEGIRDGDTWSKRAAWVDYHGPLEGELVGIAILNHPSSFRHPTPWHVRDYGLFTANAFGFNSLVKTREDKTFTLTEGTRFLLRHRIIFHKGDEKRAKIAEAFESYSKQ